MLTVDLVETRRRGGDLHLAVSDARRLAQVEALAARLGAVARAHVGEPRERVDDALDAAASEELSRADAGSTASDRRLAQAVLKLVRDGCRFEEPDAEAAVALRRTVFQRAARHRFEGAGVGRDQAARDQVLADIAGEVGATISEVEARLFADRPGAQRLLAVELAPPSVLAGEFPLHEARALLLRAVKVRAEVRAADPRAYRALFRTLKFLRLLPAVQAAAGGGYAIELDGPMSLFQASTRYGLQLGLALVAIAAMDEWRLTADLRWPAGRAGPGRHRRELDHELLRFRLEGAGRPSAADERESDPELEALVTAFERDADEVWRIDREPAVLDLPGVGLCVPDLAFVRRDDGTRVYLERLGFWSREAVWRRVDLVRAGLPHRILFAVSRALRVGEAALDDVPSAGLYVYTRTPSAREIRGRVEALARAENAGPPGRGREAAQFLGDSSGGRRGRTARNTDP